MPKTILFIDDSETSLLLFKSLFEKDEVIIQSEISSRAAFQKIRDVKPDLIVLDLMMPDIDGFQILQMIKEDMELKAIPVIILSAIHDSKTIDKTIQSGAAGFIKKPINVNEVISLIHNQLKQLDNQI